MFGSQPRTRRPLLLILVFGVFLAITLFFCLIQAAHDGITKRNRAFDDQRWWYPLYRLLGDQ